MKQYLLFLSALLFLFTSCKTKNSGNTSQLTTGNLKAVFISLAADSAYTLKTPGGAILKIGEKTFDAAKSERVQLEIKEAYTMQDILLAGLATKSNGKLLNSGGMIYINATVKGKAVAFLQPIKISIPSAAYDDKMQLFKGETENDGTINWVDPQPLDSSPIAKKLKAGEMLFRANCASCHKPLGDFTGPALAGCRKRAPSPDWAYQFTNNTNKMLETDPYAKELGKKYSSKMTQFNFKKEEIAAILDFCDSYIPPSSDVIVNSLPVNTMPPDTIGGEAGAPCGMDTSYYPMPDTSISIISSDTISPTNSPVDSIIMPEQPIYQFYIDRSGWYNIDCFADNYRDAVTEVNLSAILKMPGRIDIDVYLCVPERKLLTNGDAQDKNTYTFNKADGSIPLILNDEAIIFAMGADTSKAYYGITRFRVQAKQNIIVNMKESSKEDILKAIKNNKLDGVKIDINKPETGIIKYYATDTSKRDEPAQQMQMQIMERSCDSLYLNKVTAQQ